MMCYKPDLTVPVAVLLSLVLDVLKILLFEYKSNGMASC